MRFNKNSFLTDIGMMLFLILSFICIVVIARDINHFIFNIVMLNIAFIIVIVTYFSSLTAGIVLNVIIIFIYLTRIIYQSIVKGTVIEEVNYFWIIILPIYTCLIGMININIKKIEEENIILNKQKNELSSVDEITGLKNLRSFENDTKIFMSISKRYKMPLVLVVVKLKYYKEVERIIEKDRLPKVIVKLSEGIKHSLRAEDNIFILDNQDWTWGILLLTDLNGSNIVKERIKNEIANMELNDLTHPYAINVELKIGVSLLNCETTKNVFELIQKAHKEMEYDVN